MGDLGLIPGLGRSPGEGKGYPLQYSGLENPMGYTVHRVTKSRTWLSDFHFTITIRVNHLGHFPVEHILFSVFPKLFKSVLNQKTVLSTFLWSLFCILCVCYSSWPSSPAVLTVPHYKDLFYPLDWGLFKRKRMLLRLAFPGFNTVPEKQ